tara:strand:+ start:3246 stop:4583 length:1338 start_codon:yes stop_codon:yes gene_type:complete
MKKSLKFSSKTTLAYLCLGIFLTASIVPAQAQVAKRDHRTKEKSKTRNHKTNRAPENDVAIDDSRSNFLVTNPPRSTQEDVDKWNRIVTKMQGIEGFDPRHNTIGRPPAEKNWPSAAGWKNNWIPLNDQKQVCCGKLENFKTYDGRGAEMDWNFFVLPNDEFSFLITEALPFREETVFMSDSGWHKNERGLFQLEAEVTPDQSLRQNVFFPRRTTVIIDTVESLFGPPRIIKREKKSNDPIIGLEGRELCFYGPWIREWFHHHRPEIHPSEMIWWRERKGYYMMLIQDDSNRFDDSGDFDLDGSPSNWKPWAEPPLTAQFKIAFEANPIESGLPQKMDIRETYNRFVVTKDDPNAFADSDNGASHTLVVNNKRLLVVNEEQENDEDLGVKFVDITERADGTIQGYLQITTKVGGPDLAGDEGYHVIYVSSSKMPIVRTVRDHRTD